MNRTAFLVDGFNLYHSLRAASATLDGAGTRWLDLTAFCRSILVLLGEDARLESITYFSALARHLELRAPETIRRHEDYLECLRDRGVVVQLSHFKLKVIRCPDCSARIQRHEEKETDVAIASLTFELLHSDRCDTVVLISGDSDLAPAMRTGTRLFPDKLVVSVSPFHRVSKELQRAAGAHFKVSAAHYTRHQLPDPFVTRSGRIIHKPAAW